MDSTHNYLIVSDFHLSEGCNPVTGLIHPNEDFFQDVPLAQLIAHHVRLSRDPEAADFHQKPWRLVINGDMFDFLQVTTLPPEGDTLTAVTGKKYHKELSANEQVYGLGTEEKAIIWKLETIAAGHPLFFQALAWFLAHEGNQLILMKGNHDVEMAWEGTQARLRSLLAEAYETWATGHNPESPLPHFADMPTALTPDTLANQVRFPKKFLYQRDLFYIEHGCQYDPVNFFYDFADPRLIDEKGEIQPLIELPEGSLFVRYFFNEVEAIHPFADNFKPITRYFFWLIANAPGQLTDFVKVMLQYREARQKVNVKAKKKVKYQRQENGRTVPDPFLAPLLDIQENMRAEMTAHSKQTTRRMIGSILLALLALLLVAGAVRSLATGDYGLTVVALFFTAVCLFASGALFQSLNQLLANPYLYTVAQQVAELVNGRPTPSIGPVRYFIFGHDHAARLMLLDNSADPHRPAYRQWYINTGSWIPVFSQEDQLTRPAANLTFLRLVPSRLEKGDDLPELLRWSEEANAPRPTRIFG